MPTVTLRPEDIEDGRRGDCGWCPVALAIRRELGWRDVVVTDQWIWGTRDGRSVRFATPPAVSRFLKAFDDGERVKAFEFPVGG